MKKLIHPIEDWPPYVSSTECDLIPRRLAYLDSISYLAGRRLGLSDPMPQYVLEDLRQWGASTSPAELRPDTTGPVSHTLGEAVWGLINAFVV